MTATDASSLPDRRVLLALVIGQICLHSCMTGVRMAAPLQALRQGHEPWSVGVLMGLFALAPIVLALHAGRLADRIGYHRPLRIAVALTVAGGLMAVLSGWVPAQWPGIAFAVVCLAAMLTGAGANYGLITIQRTAGRTATNPTQLKQVFSWLGVAPALANVAGPVLAGVLIDVGGFALAFSALMLVPLPALWWARRVPKEVPPAAVHADAPPRKSWDLLRAPGVRRLLLVNWLLSASWDMHAFLVPIIGHERAFSATAIGVILGVFATAVAGVRVLIPLLAHHLREGQVLVGAMLGVAAVFALYPLAQSAWTMACFAALLGIALGSVQPMVMATLHQLTPHQRHGEAIALRSMTINMSSAMMPLLFGALGAALSASALFWLMGLAVGAGSYTARRIGA